MSDDEGHAVRASGMTLAEYQRLASRTVNRALGQDQRLLDATAGLAEEAGEALGLVRKHLFMGHDLDSARLTIELGDALWCLTVAAGTLGISLEEIAAANLAKLRRRYPEGYTDDDSVNRGDE
jgi:NTP pyrophosphatase (non-canonical NTP hydrolase)